MTQPHPTPWRIALRAGGRVALIEDAAGRVVVNDRFGMDRAAAEFLVRAVNSHEAFADELRFVLDVIGRQSEFYRGDPFLARLVHDIEATLIAAKVPVESEWSVTP